jgi:hypothetical protein
MKYIILGRGVEGCGPTQFSTEMSKYFARINEPCKIVAVDDKKWTRDNAFDSTIERVKFKNTDAVQSLIDEINTKGDLVVINSLPAVSHDEIIKESFKKLLKEVKIKKYAILFDHNSSSIQRNACIDETFDSIDAFYTHTKTNYVAGLVKNKNRGNPLKMFMGNDDVKTLPLKTTQPAFNFDEARAKYWKDIDEQDPKHLKWLGRCVAWKGYDMVFDFYHNALKEKDYLITIEGIETSIAFVDFFIKIPHNCFIRSAEMPSVINLGKQHNLNLDEYGLHGVKKIEDTDLTSFYGKLPCVFGIYNNTELLERMSKCGFGLQLSRLEKKYVGKSLEGTHCEVAATGVVPIFRKTFGDYCIHRTKNIPLTECKNSGTIWLDPSNYKESADLIEKLINDKIMRNEYREMAFDFYKEHQDTMNVFPSLFE